MLEVANFEHALFGVLSQSYSFRRFIATNPNFGFSTYLAEIHTHAQNESAPDSVKSQGASRTASPWKAVFSASASVDACPPIDLVSSLLPNPVLRTSMPAQVKWQLG
jgi:hypothetical protein